MLKRLLCLMLALLLPCHAAAEGALHIVPYEPTQVEADFAALLGLEMPTLLYAYSSDVAITLRLNVYALQGGAWILADTRELTMPGTSGRMALQCDSLEESVHISLQGDDSTESLFWQPLFPYSQPDLSFSTVSLCEEAAVFTTEEIPMYIQCSDDAFPLTIDHFANPTDLPQPAFAVTLQVVSP